MSHKPRISSCHLRSLAEIPPYTSRAHLLTLPLHTPVREESSGTRFSGGFFLLLDEHLVCMTVQVLIRDSSCLFSVRWLLTNSIHPSLSSIQINYIKVSYIYMTYFININFKVSIRHHYLISLTVTES